MAKISETIDKMIDSIPGVTVSTEGLPKKYQPRVDTDESVDIFEDTDTVYDSATGETITKSADVIREERKQVGKDREEAISILERSLNEIIIDGIDTNINLHKWIIKQKSFKDGSYSTNWLENNISNFE